MIENLNVVDELVRLFSGNSKDYLNETFPALGAKKYSFDRCLVAVCSNGTVSPPSLGSIFESAWKYENGSISTLESWPMYDIAEPIYSFAVLRIYIENEYFALGERYGMQLLCQRIGKLDKMKAASSLADFEMKWNAGK